MDIRRGRVEPELHTQRLAGLCRALEFLSQVLLADKVNRAFFKEFELFGDGHKWLNRVFYYDILP